MDSFSQFFAKMFLFFSRVSQRFIEEEPVYLVLFVLYFSEHQFWLDIGLSDPKSFSGDYESFGSPPNFLTLDIMARYALVSSEDLNVQFGMTKEDILWSL